MISKKNQKVRFNFTIKHILWREEQWNMIHLGMNLEFNLFVSDSKRFVRRKNGECLSLQCVKKTVKFRGDSVLVWRMILGPLFIFKSNINVSVYKDLIRQHALSRLRKGTVETPIFMQDNVPCHKAKTVLSFLEDEGIAVMKWPP